MSGFWGVFWLLIVMKIPIAALLYIVWWAIREPPVPDADTGDGGGRIRRDPHPRINPPNAPRRGPHADQAPAPPSRVRVTKRGPRVPDHP